MSQSDKLIERLKSKPKDFTFQEVETLLRKFGYNIVSGGKTGGSRVAFFNHTAKHRIHLHRPHPGNILKSYQVKNLICDLIERGLL